MYPRNLKPLIIVGRQRAGTRFLTNVLNSFEEIAIQGELPNPVMRSAVKFIEEVDQYYAKAAEHGDSKALREQRGWLRKREDMVLSVWEHAGQSRRVRYDAAIRYFGYKRPNNEAYFDFYERVFAYRPPIYIYCTRNFVDNYLSIASRWPDRTVERVGAEYLKSMGQYHIMSTRAPDRVLLFNLDDYVKLGLEYIDKRIIRRLNLTAGKDRRDELEQMGAKNRTEDFNVPRRRELTEAESDFIRAHPELDTEFEKLCMSDRMATHVLG